MSRGVEVGVFALNPREETADARVGPDRGCALAEDAKLRGRKGPVQRPMADRVDRNRLAPSAAPGHGMVIFDPGAEPASAKPAGLRLVSRHQQDRRATSDRRASLSPPRMQLAQAAVSNPMSGAAKRPT